jgi:signal transduction histidine kinase
VQGSGLGLAIASELAERMAGRLRVRSAPGETVFTLELPL